MTAAQRARAIDALDEYSDATVIDYCDHVKLNDLCARWFADNAADFPTAFQDNIDGDWAKTAREKRAAMEAWVAGEIRKGMGTGDIPLPDEFMEEEAA